LGGRKGIRPVKTEWWGAGVVICLEQGADLRMAQLMPLPLTVSCFSKIQIGFYRAMLCTATDCLFAAVKSRLILLVLAHPDSPRERAVAEKGRYTGIRACVCV